MSGVGQFWSAPVGQIATVLDSDAILPPVMPVGQDLKLPAVEGMKGMSDREQSLRKRWRGCS